MISSTPLLQAISALDDFVHIAGSYGIFDLLLLSGALDQNLFVLGVVCLAGLEQHFFLFLQRPLKIHVIPHTLRLAAEHRCVRSESGSKFFGR